MADTQSGPARAASFDKGSRRAEEIKALYDLHNVAQHAESVDGLIQRSLTIVVGFADLEVQNKAGVFLVDQDRNVLKLSSALGNGYGKDFAEREACIPMGACLCGRVAASGELLVSDDSSCDPRHEHKFEGETCHGHYIIPLKSRGKVLGVMFLYTDVNPPHDEERCQFLESVGGQLGIALERLRNQKELSRINDRMRRELAAASRLQKSLLPTMSPSIPGVCFDWAFQPCTELAGDIFNVFTLDEQHVGMYMLDVCGHGVASALESVAVSRMLTPDSTYMPILIDEEGGSAAKKIVAPADVAARVNKIFPKDTDTWLFLTMLYGILNVYSGEFRYVCAGHLGPIHIASDQQAYMCPTGGMPIGIKDDVTYEEHSVTIKPGERLLLYSDGALEARNFRGEIFGKQRLLQTIEANHNKPLIESLQATVRQINDWADSKRLQDDISLLAVELCRRDS